MNKSKIFGWLMILSIFVFGFLSVNAQRTTSESRKNWEITSIVFTDVNEKNEFSLNSRGTIVKVEKKNETLSILNENELQEIDALVRNLNLSQTTAKTVKGKGVYDFPFWLVGIEIGDKYYVLEGVFFSDTKVTVLSESQKIIYEELKSKLEKIGLVIPKKNDSASVNSLNLPTGFSLPLIPAEQKMLFRFEYWKSNGGFQHKGWYMDESGKVYKYSYDMTKNLQNPNSYDLKFKLFPMLFAQAKPEELVKLRELLAKIERGKYTEKEVASDKGTAAINAFIPDSATGKYRLVQLASIGDVEGINDATETEELIVLLKSLVPAD